ncbi:class I SAM-dependent DNA methyltransferase [Roseovarius aestuariivivens]|uniref:class I SAM-dependent DNA methyltransferase n=1 Tax=Roseovarius aestuariivivens TaxID=1888910 RepID=UPI001081FEDD|nr:class I SAM-dependent methyltransferase [Roseovarius aestuariivivens]
MPDKFFDKVYDVNSPEDTRALYDAWATSYETEVAENAYATPGRVARALAGYLDDKAAPVLDYGCGTGLSGVALQEAGFTNVDGMDPSADMLAQARPKGVYRALHEMDLDDPKPIPAESYRAIVCAGVIGPGAAPAGTVDLVLRALPKGGYLALSLNDHAIAAREYETALNQWIDCGAAGLLMRKYGAHLPGQNIKAFVYVLEKKK